MDQFREAPIQVTPLDKILAATNKVIPTELRARPFEELCFSHSPIDISLEVIDKQQAQVIIEQEERYLKEVIRFVETKAVLRASSVEDSEEKKLESILYNSAIILWTLCGKHDDLAAAAQMFEKTTIQEYLPINGAPPKDINCRIFNSLYCRLINSMISDDPSLRDKILIKYTSSDFSPTQSALSFSRDIRKLEKNHVYASLMTFSNGQILTTILDPYHVDGVSELQREGIQAADFSHSRGADAIVASLEEKAQGEHSELDLVQPKRLIIRYLDVLDAISSPTFDIKNPSITAELLILAQSTMIKLRTFSAELEQILKVKSGYKVQKVVEISPGRKTFIQSDATLQEFVADREKFPEKLQEGTQEEHDYLIARDQIKRLKTTVERFQAHQSIVNSLILKYIPYVIHNKDIALHPIDAFALFDLYTALLIQEPDLIEGKEDGERHQIVDAIEQIQAAFESADFQISLDPLEKGNRVGGRLANESYAPKLKSLQRTRMWSQVKQRIKVKLYSIFSITPN